MIEVNGNQFRYLKDPLFANGRRVKKVLVDGIRYYPEDETSGNLLKVSGWTNMHAEHTDDYRKPYMGSGVQRLGPCTSSLNVMGSFVAIIRTQGSARLTCDRRFDYLSPNVKPYYGWHLYRPEELVCPSIGYREQPSMSVWWSNNGAVSNRYPGYRKYSYEVLYKVAITPPAICGPLVLMDWGFWLDYTSYTPKEPYLLHATEFNDKVYSFSSDNPGNYTGVYGNMEAYFNKCRVNYDNNYSDCLFDCINVGLTGYQTTFTRRQYDNSGSGTVKVDDYICNLNSFTVACMPITNVIYAGLEEEAPQWAKTLSSDDLYTPINPGGIADG